ncbi:MAG: glutaredoxin family protein, partial [Coleofasciculaceae cyanobacterium SM2_1_6]|nr:glutaredoxin family protein [Coleofasciculaceae cyanobacterium SM2_1_6]
MYLIVYSKPGCHLCEGLIEKLAQVTNPTLELEIRDITTKEEWFDRYQYEIPVMRVLVAGTEKTLPRFSPAASVAQLEKFLEAKVTPYLSQEPNFF